jgi:PII-like signaling protein
MTDDKRATRLTIFLSEDDHVGRSSSAELLLESAKSAGLAGATIWRGIEGFGRQGHLRSARLPDLGRGLPLLVEAIDIDERITAFLEVVSQLVPGALVTLEGVHISS